jgi:hypothetical protein
MELEENPFMEKNSKMRILTCLSKKAALLWLMLVPTPMEVSFSLRLAKLPGYKENMLFLEKFWKEKIWLIKLIHKVLKVVPLKPELKSSPAKKSNNDSYI